MKHYGSTTNVYHAFIIVLFFLSIISPQISAASPSNETLLEFEWQGLSLKLSAPELHTKLKDDGYNLSKTQDFQGKNKTSSSYTHKTDTGTYQVKFLERDDKILKITFSEKRAGKKNTLNEQEVADLYNSLQQALGIDKSNCKAGRTGGGTCKENSESSSHKNEASFKVSSRSSSITISSRPIDPSTIAQNDAFVAALKPAYSCYSDVDINDKNALYQCIQKSVRIFTDLRGQKPPISASHRVIRLDYPTLTCSELSGFFNISRFYAVTHYANQKEYQSLYYGKMRSAANRNTKAENPVQGDAPIPDCSTFAEVIELGAGKPAYWSQCMGDSDDEDFFYKCVSGVSPMLVRNIRLALPPCAELQRAYQNGVSGAQAARTDARQVAVADCNTILTTAKKARGPLPDYLQACDDYNPQQSAQHLQACVTSDIELLRLTDCQGVRSAYERKLIMANGYRPDNYVPIPCDQAAPILAKAEAARERKRIEAEQRAIAIAEHQRKMAQAQREYIERINASMAAKYADTPEGIAARTSALEKQIKASGGNIPTSCSSHNYSDIYCPPTSEEVRLAMMRRHVRKSGFDQINGHLLHGQQDSILTLLFAMGGQPGRGSLGLELHYEDATLLNTCQRDARQFRCLFQLPIKFRYDELTQISMNSFTGGSAFNFNDLLFALMDSAGETEDYYFIFRLNPSGLWQAEPTIEQRLDDLQDKIDSLEYRY